MSLADYPSLEQQQRYGFQGAVVILFVALTLLTAFERIDPLVFARLWHRSQL